MDGKRLFESQENLQTIQERVNSFKCPPDIGCIPHKIVSRFFGLKADLFAFFFFYLDTTTTAGI